MRMWVLVTSNRSGEEVHPTLPFTGFCRRIHKRAILGTKRFSHQLDADVTIGQRGRLADRHFYGLHCLKGGDIEFASQEGTPYGLSDSGVQNFPRTEPGYLEVRKMRFSFVISASPAQIPEVRR